MSKAITTVTVNELSSVRVDPFLAPLRGDPRFEALAEKIVPARQFKRTVASKQAAHRVRLLKRQTSVAQLNVPVSQIDEVLPEVVLGSSECDLHKWP